MFSPSSSSALEVSGWLPLPSHAASSHWALVVYRENVEQLQAAVVAAQTDPLSAQALQEALTLINQAFMGLSASMQSLHQVGVNSPCSPDTALTYPVLSASTTKFRTISNFTPGM